VQTSCGNPVCTATIALNLAANCCNRFQKLHELT